MRLIDADRLLEILEREEDYHSDIPTRADGIRDAIMDVLSAPTADAVEVVRCKNCKFSKPINSMVIECTIWADARLKADFCSAGERKERDNDL